MEVSYLAPAGFALATWWLGTVLMLYRSTRAQPRCRVTLGWISLIGLAGLAGLVLTRDLTTPLGAYFAFLSGLSLWAWHEMSYFLGFITGPRPLACPPGESPLGRFMYGVKASLYHELAIVATALLILVINFDAANPFGTWTFILLWWMRWSAKLNIFLGVRNLHREFWPPHLQYLCSYVREAKMNRLFPVSMILAGAALGWMLVQAHQAGANVFERTGMMLLATLLALAVLEHIFLVMRVPDAILWRWASNRGEMPGASNLSTNLRAGQGS